jgi:hypothetical protein
MISGRTASAPVPKLLCTSLFGLAAVFGVVANAAAVVCSPTPPLVRTTYFGKIGIGAAYGPHYPCYRNGDGKIVPCFNNDGSMPGNVQQDAKNGELQTSVPLDLAQMQLAGFTTVRAYGDPAKVWIAMINTANNLNLNVVYEVSTCKSDAAKPGHPCLNVPGKNFQDVLDFSLVQLKQVTQIVTKDVFQKVVKLIIVGNEDLVVSPGNANIFNTADLIDAIRKTATMLGAAGVNVNNGLNNGIDLSSATVIGQMTKPPGEQLSAAYTPGAPIIENIYGAQFPISQVKTPADAVTFLKERVDAIQLAYPNNPAMVGETGWWTQGQDADMEPRIGLERLTTPRPISRRCILT